MKYSFSHRTDWELGENILSQTLQKLRSSGTELIDLTESNPTRCSFSYPEELFLGPLGAAENLIYAPHPRGMLKARQAVAGYYARRNIPLDPERIALTSSTSEAYSVLFRLLFEPGDRLLIPAPSYPLFSYLAGLNDVEIDYYRLYLDGEGDQKRWRIDLSSIATGVTSFTKAVILVSPNNPTGSCVKKDELQELNSIAERHGLSLICDEVFADYLFQDREDICRTLAGNDTVPTFVLNGVSKALALPQMKLSWIAVNGPQAFVETCMPRIEVICDTYLSVNTPVQNAVGSWLPQSDAICRQVLERVSGNFATLQNRLQASGRAAVLPAEGGWYAVLAVPDLADGEGFALRLLEEQHTFVHPGYFFDFEDEGYLVISLLPRPEVFQAGVERLVAALENV